MTDRRFWLGCAALAMLLATLIVPKLHVARAVYTVVAVLDITGSMNARDQQGGGGTISRIDMEKRALLRLLASLPCGSRLGVGIFVEERPFLLFAPVETCGNYAPLAASIAGIDWHMGWDSESHIAAALRAAVVTAKDLDADLIFMTDGQEMPPLSWSPPVDFAPVRGIVHGLLVGIGGHEFVPIPKFDRAGRSVGFWKAGEVPSETGGMFKGHEYLTAVDEPHLQALARAGGLTYLNLSSSGDLLTDFSRAAAERTQRVSVDIRYVPAAFALLLLACCAVSLPGLRR